MAVIIVDGDKCTGCKVCELACSMTKHNVFNPRKSYIRILSHEDLGLYLPALKPDCDSCGKCVELCPADALKIITTGEAAVFMKKTKIGSFPAPLISREV